MVNENILMFLLVVVLIVGCGGSVFAETSISGVSGNVSDGGSVSISGLDFGVKTTAEPLKYDDFEQTGIGYEVGDKLTNGWVAGDSISAPYHNPKYNSISTRTGSAKYVRCEWPNAGTENGVDSHCPFYYASGGTLSEVYITGWVKVDYDGYWYDDQGGLLDGNVKWFRVVHNTNPFYGDLIPGLVSSFTLNNDILNAIISHKTGGIGGTPLPTDWHGLPTDSVWVRFEYYGVESSAPGGIFNGVADGSLIVKYQQGGEGNTFTTMYNRLGYATEDNGSTDHWTAVRFCEYNRDEYVDIKFDWDEIYIDNTQARIEIGDNSSWNSCTHREIQIPTIWSDGSITFTVNQGSFSNTTAYLFVVDENGTASTGYPITFTSVINDTTPPFRSSPSPTTNLSSGTTNTTISLTTDEIANCRYSTTSGTSYALMTDVFSVTDSTTHSTLVINLVDGNTYNYYVRCNDTSGNFNTDDFLISFGVDEVSSLCGPADTDSDGVVSLLGWLTLQGGKLGMLILLT